MWNPTWKYHIQNYESLPAKLSKVTQTLIINNNLEGSAIRVLLSNQFNIYQLNIKHMKVIVRDESYKLTVNGKNEITLSAGEKIFSDGINVCVYPKEQITVELFFEDEICLGYVGINLSLMFHVTHQGQLYSKVLERSFNDYVCFGVEAVEIKTNSKPYLICCIGDSLTQQGNWSENLYQELYSRKDNIMVYNEGVSGNRLLRDASSTSSLNSIFGESLINRFKEDVYSLYSPDLIIIASGINDLVHPGNGCDMNELPTLEDMIKGYQRIEKMSSTKALFATITPFYNYDGIWDENREILRNQINKYLLTKDVLDFDSVVHLKEDHKKLRYDFNDKDDLHYNKKAGYAISKYIVGRLFQ